MRPNRCTARGFIRRPLPAEPPLPRVEVRYGPAVDNVLEDRDDEGTSREEAELSKAGSWEASRDKLVQLSTTNKRASLWILLSHAAWSLLWVLLIAGLQAPLSLALVASTVFALPQLLVGLHGYVSNPLPSPPRPPRYREPTPRSIGPEPPSTVLQASDRCEICGRPLTNPESRIARVGMECIKVHGPRYKNGPNPEHTLWIQERTKADVELASDRAKARVAHESALLSHERAMGAWKLKLEEPAALRAAAARTRARWHIELALKGALLALLIVACTALVIAL